jgi:putative FmdB family regulatory protein
MPFYEFLCTKCDKKFEEFKSISESLVFECPECKCDDNIKLLISRTEADVKVVGRYRLEQIQEEAKRDARAIEDGDMEKAADYLGEEKALEYYGG